MKIIVYILITTAITYIILALIYGFKIAPYRLKWKRFNISKLKSVRTNNLKRIIFLSDLHIGKKFTPKKFATLTHKILSYKPDVILFGGDLIEERSALESKEFKENLISALLLLSQSCPCFAVLGNHDVEYKKNRRFTVDVLQSAKFIILENEAIKLDNILLYGFKNATHDNPKFIPSDDCKNYDFTLALCHEPDYFTINDPIPGNVLYLSGHTHGGQVTLFGLPLILPDLGRKNIRGWHELSQESSLLISNGVGTVHIYARFCARPDIIILDFEQK